MSATLVNIETINTALFHVSDRDQRKIKWKDEPMLVCTHMFLRALKLAFQSLTHTNIHADIYNQRRSDASTHPMTSLSPCCRASDQSRHASINKAHKFTAATHNEWLFAKAFVACSSEKSLRWPLPTRRLWQAAKSISGEGLTGFNWCYTAQGGITELK